MTQLSVEWLVSRKFVFRAEPRGEILSRNLGFERDGRIAGYDHPNESAWRLEQDKVVFLSRDGRPTCAFSLMDGADARLSLAGEFINPDRPAERSGIIHWLDEADASGLASPAGGRSFEADRADRFPFPNLTKLANEFGSDKGNAVGDAHGYASLYSFLFSPFRYEAFSMLEIGLQIGPQDLEKLSRRKSNVAPSIDMWLKFFPHAEIHGFDISDFSLVTAVDRFQFHRGDMGSVEALAELKRNTPVLKVIIDDGSHCPYHQQVAFAHLFEKISPGGYYIIEDLHWRNTAVDRILPPTPRTEDVFTNYIKTGVFDSPVVDENRRLYLQDHMANVRLHWDERGGVNHWAIKMIAVEKR